MAKAVPDVTSVRSEENSRPTAYHKRRYDWPGGSGGRRGGIVAEHLKLDGFLTKKKKRVQREREDCLLIYVVSGD
jgi:hypothetical protein